MLSCGVGAAGSRLSGGNSGAGCGAGAIGALAGELAARQFGSDLSPTQTLQLSNLVGGLAGALVGGDAASVNIAAGVASNAVANNRLLHPDQIARIRALAENDEEKLVRLTAAACAIRRCADGLPPGDPRYNDYQAMQQLGATSDYQPNAPCSKARAIRSGRAATGRRRKFCSPRTVQSIAASTASLPATVEREC